MGGICGVVDFRAGALVERASIERMCALIAHRGPEQGVHVEGGVGLGARRLPITDLVTGQQPLSNEDGTVWVTFNGEIYNHEELRPPLEARGHRFQTKTDTEVIPHLYEEHGLDFVQHLDGNWALGLWDERRRRLVLTRDRMGRRHLMWSFKDGVARFASETKAILSDPAVSRDLDPRSIVDIVQYGIVIEDRTMFREISALRPSQMLVFEDGRLVSDGLYWDYYDVAPFEGTFEDGIDAFEDVFAAAVRSRLGGDVPYGVLQSGGIDSSLIASFVAGEGVPLRTYTISTGGIDDETDAATAVARHVGAEHTLIPLSKADPVEIAPKIPWMTDGPFMNDGLIANLLLARSIGSEVTVAITGDGGDHTFAGTWVHLGDAMAQRVPRPLAPVGAWVTDAGHALTRNRTARRLSKGFHGARIPQRSRWLAMRQHDMPGRHPGSARDRRLARERLRPGRGGARLLRPLHGARPPEPRHLRRDPLGPAAERHAEGRPRVRLRRHGGALALLRPARGRVRVEPFRPSGRSRAARSSSSAARSRGAAFRRRSRRSPRPGFRRRCATGCAARSASGSAACSPPTRSPRAASSIPRARRRCSSVTAPAAATTRT